jgi:thiol-disulfide isomerase/thioredoxin
MKKWIFTLVTLVLKSAVFVFIVINSNTLEKPDYKNVSLKEYKQKISSQNSYFMYVYKTSCGVCQEMKPSMNKVIKQEKAEIFALNAEEPSNLDGDFFEQNKLNKSPTLLYYKDGKELDRLEGFHSTEELNTFVQKYMK